jgi:hypothetical protein
MDIKERMTRLPAWAQDYIRVLWRDMAALKRERETIQDEETMIYWHIGYALDDNKYYLPDHATMTFMCAGGPIEARISKGELRISSDYRIVIAPVASNVISVKAT